MRKYLLILSLILLLGMFVICASAEDTISGTCGDVKWVVDTSTQTLTISGKGAIPDFAYAPFGWNEYSPWHKHVTHIRKVVIGEGITRIGNFAFGEMRYINSVTLPASLKEIGEAAFFGCYQLSELTIPGKVTGIGRYAFGECKSLKSLDIPDSVQTMGDFVFYRCVELKSVQLPQGLKTLGEGVFQNCVELEEIEIPDSVTSIGATCFSCCNSLLVSRSSPSPKPPWGGIPALCIIR